MTTVSASSTAARPRSRLRTRIVLAGLSAIGLAALTWAPVIQPLPRLLYNPSDSVAPGWYRVETLQHQFDSLSRLLVVGSIVLITSPTDSAPLAAQRGYLPAHVPLLKRVGAVAPQHVCVIDGQVHIDGVPLVAALSADRLGRPLPSWQHCRPLDEGELFLLSVINPASFDSRYFGPVSASAVIGIAHPIWLEARP